MFNLYITAKFYFINNYILKNIKMNDIKKLYRSEKFLSFN